MNSAEQGVDKSGTWVALAWTNVTSEPEDLMRTVCAKDKGGP